jgi:hypothetical protein
MDENTHKQRESPEEIAALLDAVSDKLPKLIKNLLDSLYSPEAGMKMGKAVAEFRKALVEGGIPDAEATEMTKQYLSTLSLLSRESGKIKYKKEEKESTEEDNKE